MSNGLPVAMQDAATHAPDIDDLLSFLGDHPQRP
jgi:hypothetical protein